MSQADASKKVLKKQKKEQTKKFEMGCIKKQKKESKQRSLKQDVTGGCIQNVKKEAKKQKKERANKEV